MCAGGYLGWLHRFFGGTSKGLGRNFRNSLQILANRAYRSISSPRSREHVIATEHMQSVETLLQDRKLALPGNTGLVLRLADCRK